MGDCRPAGCRGRFSSHRSFRIDQHQQIVATVKNFIQAKAEANPNYFSYLTKSPPTLAKLVFTAIQKESPDLYEQLKTSGKLKNRNETTASMAGNQSVDDIKAELMRVLNQVEVPPWHVRHSSP